MCGIVAYIGLNTADRDRAFRDLLQIDVIRGPHSTGVAFIDNNIIIVKDVVPPTDLILTHQFSSAIGRQNVALIGHNRFATQGEITKENAHPFRHRHITGVHNGTVSKFALEKLADPQKYATDSEVIIDAIAEKGIEYVWGRLNGAAALLWWDNQAKSLNFIRNLERELYFASTVTDDGLLVASEAGMIRLAAHRNKIFLKNVMRPNPNVLFSFHYQNGKVIASQTELKSWVWSIGRDNYQSYPHVAPVKREPIVSYSHLGGDGKKVWPRSPTRKEKKMLKKLAEEAEALKIKKEGQGADILHLPFMQKAKEKHDEAVKYLLERHACCIFCNEELGPWDDKIEVVDENMGVCGDCAEIQREVGIRQPF